MASGPWHAYACHQALVSLSTMRQRFDGRRPAGIRLHALQLDGVDRPGGFRELGNGETNCG
jgi:hypothetical protein